MGRLALVFAVAAVVGPIVVLAGVGAVVWVRTSGLRAGRPEPGRQAVTFGDVAATSRTTVIPAAGGLGIVAAGALGTLEALGKGRGSPPLALILACGAVWWGGFAGRVTGLRAGPAGLTIRWRRRPGLSMAWASCSELRPPRWPLGGWTVRGSVGGLDVARMLMPSDLMGNEAFLASVVAHARLAFEGRTWRRDRSWAAATVA